MSPEVLIVLLSTWTRVAFASFQVIRKVAFLCVFNSVICLVSSTFKLHLVIVRRNCFLFFMKSLLCILCNNPLVIHGARFLLILFSLRGACLSMQLTNNGFHSYHLDQKTV